MGDLLRITGFDKPNKLQKLTQELNATSQCDTRAICDAGMDGNQLQGVLISKVNKASLKLDLGSCMQSWMQIMRNRFAKHIIHRTIDSLDYCNQKLFGMRPYMEHFLMLCMYDWEMNNLCSFVKEIVKDNLMAAAADTCKVSIFIYTMSCLEAARTLVITGGCPRHRVHVGLLYSVSLGMPALSSTPSLCRTGAWGWSYQSSVTVCAAPSKMVSALCTVILQYPCPMDHQYQITLHTTPARTASAVYAVALHHSHPTIAYHWLLHAPCHPGWQVHCVPSLCSIHTQQITAHQSLYVLCCPGWQVRCVPSLCSIHTQQITDHQSLCALRHPGQQVPYYSTSLR